MESASHDDPRIVSIPLPSGGDGPRARWRTADLAAALHAVAAEHADRVALVAGDESVTYQSLFDRAARLATMLTAARQRLGGPALAAVMGSRSASCFAAVLGVLYSGAAYVPLNPSFPSARTAEMLRASGARTLVIEQAELRELAPVLHELPRLAVLVPDAVDVAALRALLPGHDVDGAESFASAPASRPIPVDADALAYVMFTSGSTGRPKGVMVSRRNVMACMASFGDRFAITAEDRFSQNFDLTFDLSVFDMFLCWLHGASLHVAPPAQRAAPARFAVEAELTVWFSVPSMALFMEKTRALKPGLFPSLRWSLFCGERLPVEVARAWSLAAPQSIVENLYGPTEVTIACTAHRFNDADVAASAERKGSVPIGLPLPGLKAALVDDGCALVAVGATGELCIAGSQVAPGYLDAPEITAQRFVQMPWDPSGAVWYRTGDLGVRIDGDNMLHLGRADDQVKIRGYRVELGDIEFALRKALGSEAVSAVAIMGRHDVIEIIAFAAVAGADVEAVAESLADVLPGYMHPKRIILLEQLPLNANGKVDKTKLRRDYLEQHANA